MVSSSITSHVNGNGFWEVVSSEHPSLCGTLDRYPLERTQMFWRVRECLGRQSSSSHLAFTGEAHHPDCSHFLLARYSLAYALRFSRSLASVVVGCLLLTALLPTAIG